MHYDQSDKLIVPFGLKEDEVVRDHLLTTIDDILNTDIQLLVIEGCQGSGKSVLLYQYIMFHKNNTIPLFMKPTSKFAYAPEFLRFALTDIIASFLKNEAKEEIPYKNSMADAYYDSVVYRLQSYCSRTRNTIVFVIDGLEDIPGDDIQSYSIILKDILPIGLPRFKFILSGDLNTYSDYLHKAVIAKSFPLIQFSLDETIKYFNSIDLDYNSVVQLYKLCRGIPGHLQIVKRMLVSGISISDLIDNDPKILPEFLAIEFNSINSLSEKEIEILALIAFSRTACKLNDIVRMTGLSREFILKLKDNISILCYLTENDEISYVSEHHRKYATNKFDYLKTPTLNRIIDDTLENIPNGNLSLELPYYYGQLNKLEEFLDLLAPEYLSTVLEKNESIGSIIKHVEHGIEIASSLGRKADLIRFSIQRSALAERENITIMKAEVEAMMALKDYDKALILAQSISLKEDRLQLLSIIAKAKRGQGMVCEQEIIDQIRLLSSQIDPAMLGERAIDIATDLICIEPDLAIELVEKATQSNGDIGALDLAFARLSFEAIRTVSDSSISTEAMEKAHSKISDPKVSQFIGAATLFLRNCSAEEAIKVIENIEPKNRIFLLRLWALSNSNRNDTISIIEYALDLIVRTTPYTPLLRDLREIASPLSNIKDIEKLKELVKRFDGQKGLLEPHSPSVELIRLQMLLAKAELKYDRNMAWNRVLESYLNISELRDLSIKSECLAWIYVTLKEIDPNNIFERKEHIKEMTLEDLNNNIEQLLYCTADQNYVIKGIISALAPYLPELSLNYALNLNTQSRRDEAILDFIKYSIIPDIKPELKFIESAIDKIVNAEFRDEAIEKYFELLSRVDNSDILKELMSDTLFDVMVDRISHINIAYVRASTYCYVYEIIKKNNEWDQVKTQAILIKLEESWNAIDAAWAKAEMGYKIVNMLAIKDNEKARYYLDCVEKLREAILFDSDELIGAFIASVRLSIRAMGGLLTRGYAGDEDIEKLGNLIERIPSLGERARLWGELALRCFNNKCASKAENIVNEHLRPLLNDISELDNDYKMQVIIDVAPTLYCAHRLTAYETIQSMPLPHRDLALSQICAYIFTKKPSSEPYEDTKGAGFKISYEESVDLCDIISRLETDIYIYSTIEDIVDSLLSRHGKETFTQNQIIDITNRIDSIIQDRLPDKNNIKHDGYKIIAFAQTARLKHLNNEYWNNLIRDARNISNLADKALVLSSIASIIQKKDNSKADSLIREAIGIIDEIPSSLDRAGRYIALSEAVAGYDSSSQRSYLRIAMQAAIKIEEDDSSNSIKKKIIDLAYKIDTSLASSLASLADDDPVRMEHKAILKNRVKILEMRKNLTGDNIEPTSDMIKQLPQASWMNLGSLNAGRISTIHFNDCGTYIQAAAKLPIKRSYPILAWSIENAVVRHSNTDEARILLVPIFESTLMAAELSARVASRLLRKQKTIKEYAQDLKDKNIDIIIKAGQREKAVNYIKYWFHDNCKDKLFICDAYFSVEDLELFHILRQFNEKCRFKVLTSQREQEKSKIIRPWEETYRKYWRQRISDQDPPDLEIIIIGSFEKGDSPIHDRWWIGDNGGLRVGTSFKSLGSKKISEISELSAEQAAYREAELNQYILERKREVNGQKYLYTTFTL